MSPTSIIFMGTMSIVFIIIAVVALITLIIVKKLQK